NHGETVTVIALTGVEYAGNTTNITQGQFVVAVFCTTCSKDHGVLWKCGSKFSVVFTIFHAAVAACHYKELADCTRLHGLNYLVGQLYHLVVGKTANDFTVFNLLGSSAALGMFNDLREVLATTFLAL